MSEEKCSLCLGILPKKARRNVLSETFPCINAFCEVWGIGQQQIPTVTHGKCYVCSCCFNKLNKLEKINFDINKRLNQLKLDKEKLLQELRINQAPISVTQPADEAASNTAASFTTPVKGKKRLKPSVHTPSPRKFKTKPPSSTDVPKQRLPPLTNVPKQKPPQKGHVKVLYRESEVRQRTRIIKDPPLKSVMKCLIRGAQSSTIAKKILSVPSLKKELLQCFLTIINKECTTLCSTKQPSPLRTGKLQEFKVADVLYDLEQRSPTLHNVIKTTIKHSQDASIAVCAAVLLKNRQKQMSRIPHIISQILDHGGATDEVIDTLSKVGICVAANTMSDKRKQLVGEQEEKISTLMEEVKQRELQHKVNKAAGVLATLSIQSEEDSSQGTSLMSNAKDVSENEFPPFDPYFNVKFEPKSALPRNLQYTCPDNLSCSITETHYSSDMNRIVLPEETVVTKNETIVLPEVQIFSGMCDNFETTSIASMESTKQYLSDFVARLSPQLEVYLPTVDIIGEFPLVPQCWSEETGCVHLSR